MVALLASRAGTFTGDLRAADLFTVDGLTYAAGLFAAWDDLGEVASALCWCRTVTAGSWPAPSTPTTSGCSAARSGAGRRPRYRHPGALTENAIRRELGLPLRESYGLSPGDDRRVEFRETEV